MAITTTSDVIVPEVLTEAVKGAFGQKTAFMGSVLRQLGVVVVSGSMPVGGPKAVGTTIKVPYFGTIGEFASNAEGSSVTPSEIKEVTEDATVTRESLAFEVSAWAQGNALVNPNVGDPYEESARQIQEAATRCMDKQIITEAASSGIYSKSVYSSSVPRTIDYDLIVDAKVDGWHDEQEGAAGILMHSRTYADALKLKDSVGRPLLTVSQNAETEIAMMAGLRVVVSDRVPLTSSAMGTVTSSGTAPPVATLAGVPLGPWRLHIDCTLTHASNTTIRFSTDGGNTWSADIAAADDSVAVALTDTASDSLVGKNGLTGITVAFAAGSFNSDNLWTSTASLQVTSLLLKKGALAYWYAGGRLGLKTDVDIMKDSDLAAMHLYAAPHRYRRMPTGTKPGVVPIVHNVGGFT